MISVTSKKFIFISFLLINLIPSLKATEFRRVINEKNNPNNSLVWSLYPYYVDELNPEFSNDQIVENTQQKTVNKKNTFNGNSSQLSKDLVDGQNELVIQSDIQTETNNILNAKGNVSVYFQGKILTANSLIYDKSKKNISATGNISLRAGDQIFKMNKFYYDFKKEKGSLLNVRGLIITDNLIDDLSANFSNSDIQEIKKVFDFNKKKVVHTPNMANNWKFFSKRINIEGQKWKSEKVFFSNDLLEFKQLKVVINSLEAIFSKDELRFKSSLNYLVLDEKVSVPFWFGNRTITKSGEGLDSKSSWTLGYDNLDRDGLFIGRKLNSFKLVDDFVLDLEPQFLVQRSINGHTNSFVKKGDLITGDKVKRDINFADFFGLKSQIKGNINSWDLAIQKELNSFDFNKFSDALRVKSKLSKEINFLNQSWDKIFYGVYRDRVWNGSLGESEIYLGYGSKLEKQNTWEVNGSFKTEEISFGLANLKAEALNNKNLTTNLKGNIYYSLDQKIPLSVDKPKSQFIDSTYIYIPEPISKGLSLNTKLAGSFSLYENGKHQEYVGYGIGPEFIFGDFKDKTFDYTRIAIFPFYKVNSGDSVFKFDQISDNLTLDLSLDQQLFGPLIFKSNGTLNLDGHSENYAKFINSKISLNWKKRSYEFGIFYQPNSESGGIAFSLFGFK